LVTSVANCGAEDSKGNVPMSCTLIVTVPKHRSVPDVAHELRRELRPKVYDCTLGGYRPLEFSVAERGKEVHMTIHGVTGSDATTVWGQVSDDLYGRQLSCVLNTAIAKAA
jgi:hypothetical protein